MCSEGYGFKRDACRTSTTKVMRKGWSTVVSFSHSASLDLAGFWSTEDGEIQVEFANLTLLESRKGESKRTYFPEMALREVIMGIQAFWTPSTLTGIFPSPFFWIPAGF